MPDSETASWLITNTSLTFDQIGAFCAMSLRDVQEIADGEVEVMANDPITAGMLTEVEIARCVHDPRARLARFKPLQRGPAVEPALAGSLEGERKRKSEQTERGICPKCGSRPRRERPRLGLPGAGGGRHMTTRVIDLTGQKFGRLTVIERAGYAQSGPKKEITWFCQCSCGNRLAVRQTSLRSGNTKSC